jgi:sugar-specific transcriptional regulator TrmB
LYIQRGRTTSEKESGKVSLERVLKALTKLGLSQREAEVYIYLATKGPQKAGNIAETLNLNKQYLCFTLRSLKNKRIVNVTREYSTQFSALPFETAIDLLAEAQRKEAQRIEENKETILSHWRSMPPRNTTNQ